VEVALDTATCGPNPRVNVVALQFLIIWRLFRGAALLDGLDPPENMLRCVCNNYDVEVGASCDVQARAMCMIR
jgi:hypothetical protein